MVLFVLIVPLASAVSRQSILRIGCALGIIGMVMFSLTGGIQERSPFQTAIYYFAQTVHHIACPCALLGAYQLAVDLYPVQAASTSAAVVIFTGRIGPIAAPFIFETFKNWQGFYYFIAILCAISFLMATMLLSPPLPAAIDQKAPVEKANDLESTPLLTKG